MENSLTNNLTISRVNELFKDVLPFTLSDETYNALQSLPEKQRICVTLRYICDYSFGEIAEVLGCSEVTVRSNISKAKQKTKGYKATKQQKQMLSRILS